MSEVCVCVCAHIVQMCVLLHLYVSVEVNERGQSVCVCVIVCDGFITPSRKSSAEFPFIEAEHKRLAVHFL